MKKSIRNTKLTYEKEEMVSYYEYLSEKFGAIESEKKIFNRFLKKEYRILDVGCGTGRTTKFLSGLCDSVIGLDLSENMIAKAMKLYPEIDFFSGDIINYSNNNKFNAIVFSFNGLMTIPGHNNRKSALKNINKNLYINGLFIFSIPYLDNKLNLPFWKKRMVKSKHYSDLYIDDQGIKNIYIHIPMLYDVMTLITETGFEILYHKARLDICAEEACIEEHLDDNYYFVIRKIRD